MTPEMANSILTVAMVAGGIVGILFGLVGAIR